jgi:hypothetical protein
MSAQQQTAPARPQERRASVAGYDRFVDDVFGYLPRADQRRWADAYLRGLLTVPGKKTIRRMAQAVSLSTSGPQALQQFISASPWDWDAARAEIARKAAEHLPPHAWTIGTVFAEKRGEHSVGVRRRFVAGTGRTVNCQVGVGLFLTSSSQSIPVDWRLLLDGAWSDDEQRRRRARVPETAREQPLWAHVLDLTDRLDGLRLSGPAPLVVDRHCPVDPSRLAAHLHARQRDFLIEIGPEQHVLPSRRPGSGAGAPTEPRPVSAQQFIRDGRARHPYVISVERDGKPLHLNVFSSAVRLPALRPGSPCAQSVYRLLVERSPNHRRPTRMWITSLPDRRMEEALRLLRRPALTQAALHRLQSDFGLLDFEGRSFPGWHHHMTLATAAYVYSHLSQGAGHHVGAL